jgi:hypothetical protein
MKQHNVWILCAATLALGLGSGCMGPSERRPMIVYPVTYDVPVGNTQVSASTGAQNLKVSPTQEVTADVGEPLYYQIVSPVPVNVAIYERRSPDRGRVLVREFQGTSLTNSIIPAEPHLEFQFAALQPNSSGTLQFTLSDRPLAPSVVR